MAEEGASSSSNSFDEIGDRRETHPYSSVYGANYEEFEGMMGLPRLSYNPFAIKTATPTRSLADSTDNKESRPVVAPPTLKLGHLDYHCGITSSAPKLVLRPSSLTAQAELLKFMNMHESGIKQDGKENIFETSSNVTTKDIHSSIHESNGKFSKVETFTSGTASNNINTSKVMNFMSPRTTKHEDIGLNPGNSNDNFPDRGSFVFGQNLHERVLNYDEYPWQPSSLASLHNLSFEEAALKREFEKKERKEQQAKFTKSLTESAKEYESKQVKRKFDEVTVITGEEEESNVLQVNCKLFAFNKFNSSWQERGRGILRLNDREVGGVLHSRVVMRTQGSLRVILNTKVWAGMSVEHPSTKTVRITAIDTHGVKVFLVMANPKDAEQLFSALDWRITTLKSNEDSLSKCYGDTNCSIIEEATSSSGILDTSSKEYYGDLLKKRPRISFSQEGGADSSTEMEYFAVTTSEISSDSLVDSTDTSNTPNQDNADCTTLVSD